MGKEGKGYEVGENGSNGHAVHNAVIKLRKRRRHPRRPKRAKKLSSKELSVSFSQFFLCFFYFSDDRSK